MASNNASTMATEFAALIEPLGKARSGVGPTMSKQAMQLLAFDIEQRHWLAETRALVSSLPQGETTTRKKKRRRKAKRTAKSTEEQTTLTAKQQEMKKRMQRQQSGTPKKAK